VALYGRRLVLPCRKHVTVPCAAYRCWYGLLEDTVLFQVMRVMLVSVAVKGRGRKMTIQTERRIRRNAAYFLKWPPTS
jgi:hypothetical protein